jgi:putative CocE/NonD family hydrolase
MKKSTRCLFSSVLFSLLWLVPTVSAHGQAKEDLPKFIREHYVRTDHQIPMRDGVRLFTVVYAPKDASQKYPLLMMRTPYSVGPYEKGQYRFALGPNPHFVKEGYIFVYQDVRGRYLSEGTFENMRPHRPVKTSKLDIDESSDTFDTIDWLLRNVPGHNGKVGQWGISYPGFYASAGMIEAHPALQAVSPQAPIADWFFDDFYHHGAFFLTHAFNFFSSFGQPRPEPTTARSRGFNYETADGYQFFLGLGPLDKVNERLFKDRVAFWERFVEHPNYDDFWKARNLLPHLKKVAPAVMTVGGWFDAEDLYGPLKTYREVEKNNPGVFNVLVMGPWAHGAWSSADSSRLGNIAFGSNPSAFYQKDIELAFFNHFLKGMGEHRLPEAYMFETGVNRWRQFDRWPPPVQRERLYFRGHGGLALQPSEVEDAFDEYISDPNRPVPYTEAITTRMTREYMTDDQRFASRRPDVAVYQTEPLTGDLTLAGPLRAELFVSTTGTDADWVVKVIDVFPDTASEIAPSGRPLAGYQMMVRSEVIRGRFRNSYSRPEPFVANQPTKVSLELQDVLHTFRKGHRVMVQICNTWFPLVDRNPQKYVANIFRADESDFMRARQRIYRGRNLPTNIQIGILNAEASRGSTSRSRDK